MVVVVVVVVVVVLVLVVVGVGGVGVVVEAVLVLVVAGPVAAPGAAQCDAAPPVAAGRQDVKVVKTRVSINIFSISIAEGCPVQGAKSNVRSQRTDRRTSGVQSTRAGLEKRAVARQLLFTPPQKKGFGARWHGTRRHMESGRSWPERQDCWVRDELIQEISRRLATIEPLGTSPTGTCRELSLAIAKNVDRIASRQNRTRKSKIPVDRKAAGSTARVGPVAGACKELPNATSYPRLGAFNGSSKSTLHVFRNWFS